MKVSSSSSPRAQAKRKSEAPKKVRAASLDDVFGDPAIKAAYLSKWADKAIANGRQVDLVDMDARGQNIKPHLDALGWTPILSVKELQYARLVRAFYAAAKFKTNCNVSVTLKGISIKLTLEFICNLFHIENRGVHLHGDKVFDHYKLDRDEVFESFLKEGFDGRPIAANLNPKCHLFHNITVRTILARAGSWDKVNNSDLNVVYHLVHKKPLSLGYLILAHMKHPTSHRRSTPYVMLLTNIFREFKVPLDDEIGSDECVVIDGSILGRLRISTVPKPKNKKTATHKISGCVKKKGKLGEPLAEAEAEAGEKLLEHEADLSESGSETPEPSEEIEYSTPEPEPEIRKEGSESEAETGESEDDSKSEEVPGNENKDEAEKEDVQQDHALAEDNITHDHNTPPIPSPRKSPSPITFEHQSSPLPNLNEDVQEGFNSMFFGPASLIPFNLNPYQYYSMTGGFHLDDEMQGISQGQTSNSIPSTSFISPKKSSDNPLLEASRNFITSPILDPKLNKPSSSSPLPEPSHFGSLGSFGNTDSGNTHVPTAVGPTNADVILNMVGLQQTVASYGNRQAVMNNWMLGEFLPVVAPNLAPLFLPEIAYLILPVAHVPNPAPEAEAELHHPLPFWLLIKWGEIS